jgi:hypothetical protein
MYSGHHVTTQTGHKIISEDRPKKKAQQNEKTLSFARRLLPGINLADDVETENSQWCAALDERTPH